MTTVLIAFAAYFAGGILLMLAGIALVVTGRALLFAIDDRRDARRPACPVIPLHREVRR